MQCFRRNHVARPEGKLSCFFAMTSCGIPNMVVKTTNVLSWTKVLYIMNYSYVLLYIEFALLSIFKSVECRYFQYSFGQSINSARKHQSN